MALVDGEAEKPSEKLTRAAILSLSVKRHKQASLSDSRLLI
jgi:hypothetical protein